jgi:cytochrome c5
VGVSLAWPQSRRSGNAYQWQSSLMRSILLGVLAAALLVTNANAHAANDMVPACKGVLAILNDGANLAKAAVLEAGHCGGVVYGLMYATCHPSGVTAAQAINVVLAYIGRHPQRMHEDFRTLAIEAMHEAWPCRR